MNNLSISVEQVSQPDDIMQVGCLLGAKSKNFVHILMNAKVDRKPMQLFQNRNRTTKT